ncbi:hypothetical protein ACUOCP_56075, partial [Escherichia sp. R-CC3]
ASSSGNQVASKSSKYGKRLAKIAKALGNNINGTPVNYKVYMTSDVNAWAMANGCVRVYSGPEHLQFRCHSSCPSGHCR